MPNIGAMRADNNLASTISSQEQLLSNPGVNRITLGDQLRPRLSEPPGQWQVMGQQQQQQHNMWSMAPVNMMEYPYLLQPQHVQGLRRNPHFMAAFIEQKSVLQQQQQHGQQGGNSQLVLQQGPGQHPIPNNNLQQQVMGQAYMQNTMQNLQQQQQQQPQQPQAVTQHQGMQSVSDPSELITNSHIHMNSRHPIKQRWFRAFSRQQQQDHQCQEAPHQQSMHSGAAGSTGQPGMTDSFNMTSDVIYIGQSRRQSHLHEARSMQGPYQRPYQPRSVRSTQSLSFNNAPFSTLDLTNQQTANNPPPDSPSIDSISVDHSAAPPSPSVDAPLIPTCSICFEKLISTVVAPCYHFFCENCAPKIRNCATCRRAIESKHKVYF